MKIKQINIMVIDLPILSDPLPGKKEEFTGLEGELLRNQMFELVCYIAQKEREKNIPEDQRGSKACERIWLKDRESRWKTTKQMEYKRKFYQNN